MSERRTKDSEIARLKVAIKEMARDVYSLADKRSVQKLAGRINLATYPEVDDAQVDKFLRQLLEDIHDERRELLKA